MYRFLTWILSFLFQHTAARRRLGFRSIAGVAISRFQHTAARRRLGPKAPISDKLLKFQHTAARRRLGSWFYGREKEMKFQHTAARRRLGTHNAVFRQPRRRFNTQPPEGGWTIGSSDSRTGSEFQHTAARRRLAGKAYDSTTVYVVSTHSRPKAAGSSLV